MWISQSIDAQHCFLILVEKCPKILDFVGILLTDLPKTFDCINHDPLIANYNALSFSLETLKFFEC